MKNSNDPASYYNLISSQKLKKYIKYVKLKRKCLLPWIVHKTVCCLKLCKLLVQI